MEDQQAKSKVKVLNSILKKPKSLTERRRSPELSSRFVDKSSSLKNSVHEKASGDKASTSRPNKDVKKKNKSKRSEEKEDIDPLPQGCTPLMYACQQGDFKKTVEFIEKDPSQVHRRDRSHRTCLHYCAGALGDAGAACAGRALMAGAEVGARDADGLSALHVAAVRGDVPLMALLLANGADVAAVDDEGHTVVHWATVCGELGALRAALAAGAPAATPDKHGGYPLHYAAQMCGVPPSGDSQTALEVLRALVREGGARSTVRDADGRAPLLWAASAGSAPALLALVQAGADVDDADRDGLTALHCAASRGHTSCCEALVALCGARVDAADANGCTALHYAATLGHADAAALLLRQGAKPDRTDRKGRAPAHCACAKGQLETVRILGSHAANLWLRNARGDLPLHEAVASGRRELVKWLLDMRPTQVNATNNDARTPLHISANTDNTDLCRLLLDRGAQVNAIMRTSKNVILTPLDCAMNKGYRSTAKYLQMQGGVPASRLKNAKMTIDQDPISVIPQRHVKSTRINVRDQIEIEKREVFEISTSTYSTPRHTRRRNDSDSSDSSDEYRKSQNNHKRDKRKIRKSRHDKRKEYLERNQKSFSDGYDSDHKKTKRTDKFWSESDDVCQKKKSKKTRSRSEPCSKHYHTNQHRGKGCRRSRQRSKHHYSSSESSETETSQERKKHKRHRKRSKRKSSQSSSSSSESSERRSMKKKGKKSSTDVINNETNKETAAHTDEPQPVLDMTKVEESIENNYASGTETDTLSLKTSTVVTEAQVHVEREVSEEIGKDANEATVSKEPNGQEESQQSKTPNALAKEPIIDDKKTTEATSANISKEMTDSKLNRNLEPDIKSSDLTTTEASLKLSAPSIEKEHKSEEVTAVAPEENVNNLIAEMPNEVNKFYPSNNSVEQSPTVVGGSEKVPENTKEVVVSSKGDKTKESGEIIIEKDATNRTSEIDNSERVNKENIEGNVTENAVEEKVTEKKSSTSFSVIEENGLTPVDSIHVMGETVEHTDANKVTLKDLSKIGEKVQNKDNLDAAKTVTILEKKESPTVGGDINPDSTDDRGLVSIIDETGNKAIQQILQNSSSLEENQEPNTPTSLQQIRKSSKENIAPRRKSIYETESYKVLSDVVSAIQNSPTGILKNTSPLIDKPLDSASNEIEGEDSNRFIKEITYTRNRMPSVSDNEIYSHGEIENRRKRLRKKNNRTKSQSSTIRSKSENSELGYESSGLMDSGFEPSPRIVNKTRTMSPRLEAYYQQRNARGKHSAKSLDSKIPVRKPGDKYAVDMSSVTQRIQTNMRRYYCERKIFHHLLELKRLQIRSSKTKEAILVKRAIDEYNESSLATVGCGPYSSPDLTFSNFEKFLYDTLRKLQKSGKKHLDNLPEKPIDFDYGESELYKLSCIPDNPCLCTSKTHRCFHAVHAYTGIPCSAYIPGKMNHHTMPKPSTASSRSTSFLPKISQSGTGAMRRGPTVTLELQHGSDKQLISLPSEKLEKNKRYYVTFTVKGSNVASGGEKKNDTQNNTTT